MDYYVCTSHGEPSSLESVEMEENNLSDDDKRTVLPMKLWNSWMIFWGYEDSDSY